MAIVSKPKTTFILTEVPQLVDNAPQRILIIGQQITDQSTVDKLVKNIEIGAEDTLFGRQTMLATMIRSFRKLNTLSQVDAIPLNDPAGTTAEATITIETGTISQPTSIDFFIQSKDFKFEIDLLVGDDESDIATKIAAAINANDEILVTAAQVLGVVTLTATNSGEENNAISIEFIQKSFSGLTVTIVGFAGGTLSPDISNIFTQISNIRYQTIVYPASYTKSTIKNLLNTRFNTTNAVLDGVAIASQTDSLGDLESEGQSLDSLSMVILGNRASSGSSTLTQHAGSALFEYDPSIASYTAALRTLRLTENANVANIVIGDQTQFGGPQFASIPYFNTPVETLTVIEEERGWKADDQESLNDNGIAFLGNNTSSTRIIFGAMVTTYLTNGVVDDTTFKFLNTVDTGSQIREFYFNNNKSNYAQSVLTSGDIVPGSRQVDVASFNSFQEKLYKDLSVQPFALTVAGSAALDFYKNNINTTFTLSAGLVSVTMVVPIVVQLREIDATIQITFDINTTT